MDCGGIKATDAVRGRRLLREWSNSFTRLENAWARCEEALDEKPVHELRLACRRGLPVLELLRELRPRAQRVHHALLELKAVLRVLGPLRDAQVRSLRLADAPTPQRSRLLAKAQAEERALKPGVRRALENHRVALPKGMLKDEAGRTLIAGPDAFENALRTRLEHRCRRYRERWSARDKKKPKRIHRARIALKKYRYMLHALRPVLDRKSEGLMHTLKERQASIGKWHDDYLFRKWEQRMERTAEMDR